MDPEAEDDDALLRPEHCVAAGLHAAARAVTRIYAQELRPLGVRRGQFSILAALARLGDAPVTELAERLVLDRTTLTRHLAALTRNGWVTLTPDPGDRRRRRVALTTEGRARFGLARDAWRRAQERVLAACGPTEILALEQRLRALRQRVATVEEWTGTA
jgi:DNA-binding MarR family transcriptional regulator